MKRFSMLSAGVALALALTAAGGSAQAQYSSYPYWGSAPSSYQPSVPNFTMPSLNPGFYSNSVYMHPGYSSFSPFYGGYGVNWSGLDAMGNLPGAGYTPRSNNAAHIRLRVPPDAEVWFDGNKTKQTGEVRNFYSPQLTPGKTYVYNLRVRWKKDGQDKEATRKVRVQARESVPVDLTK